MQQASWTPHLRRTTSLRSVLHRVRGTPSMQQKDRRPMPDIKLLNPSTLGKPLGPYSHVARVKASEFLFIAGQVGADASGKAGASFDEQCDLTFKALGAALSSQDASFGNVVEFTTYMVHSQDIPKFMAWRAREFPKLFPSGAYPPNTLLIIDRLVREDLLIEISAVAAL
jgi:enamine deaminase RidA (YjgF/YER057c/UK114 family)